jgi:beta-aspartyl-dipeptidase (metallo-type)
MNIGYAMDVSLSKFKFSGIFRKTNGGIVFRLLKNGYCYSPDALGKRDVLVVCGRICKIEPEIDVQGLWDVEVIDCSGRSVCPAFIDQHVHITGGGGEEGPASRIPELMLGEILMAGIGTVVGVLGVDHITRNVANVLAKAKALELEGITTYIYTGSYSVPTATITGKVISDLAFIDKVIGVGEIAISDYRSSHQTIQMLKELAYEAKVGGMIGGKAGIVHMHVGDGKGGLAPLFELVDSSDYPLEMFVPTHINRSKELFTQALEFARRGGYIDLTAGEKPGAGWPVPEGLEQAKNAGISLETVTISSDGNGSMPAKGGGEGICKVAALYEDFKSSILGKKLPVDLVLKTITSNVAKLLKIFPVKGTVEVGSDADLLVLDSKDLSIQTVLLGGEVFVRDGRLVRKGRYEK